MRQVVLSLMMRTQQKIETIKWRKPLNQALLLLCLSWDIISA